MPNELGWNLDSNRWWREPAGAVAGSVLLLTDADGSTPLNDPSWGTALDRHGLAAVAPISRDLWWTDRLPDGESGPSAEALLTSEVLPWARQRWGDRVALAGVGTGGHGALRLAYKLARDFPVVAAWRPALDCHLLLSRRLARPQGLSADAINSLAARYRDPEHCRQDAATLHLHPLGWPRRQWFGCPLGDAWWDGADRLRMKLAAIGIPFECDLDTPIAPNDPAVADRVVSWIASTLQSPFLPGRGWGRV